MKVVIVRALHTFWQAFVPVFLGGVMNVAHVYGQGGVSGAKSALIALIVAAVAAGLSAVKNVIVVRQVEA